MWSKKKRVAAVFAVSSLLSSAAAATAPTVAPWPYQTFETEPTFQPPQLKVTPGSGQPAPGYLFFAPAAKAHQTAPLIMTDDSELIWHGQNYNAAFNFGVQTYKGQPVLVYWNGTVFPEPIGRGYGTIVILDNTYSPIANVTLPGHFVTSSGQVFQTNVDLHEIFITNRNTVLVTTNNVTQTDLSSVGGPSNGWIVDCLVYEIDIESNEVLFHWSTLGHEKEIPLTASVYPLGTEGFTGQNQSTAWGYFHINAVAPLNDGYIISSRYTCSIIAIDGRGKVLWRLSGRDGADFTQGPGTSFCYQHDIRAVYENPQTYSAGNQLTVHLHDNANCPTNNGTTPTSGLRLNLNVARKQVTLGHRYENPANPLFSTAQGNYQDLPDNHVLLGHGFIPFIEEFDNDGNIVETIQFGSGIGTISYRAFRQPWIGCPNQRPALDVTASGTNELTLYMSWNGATEYDHWIIRAPGKRGAMQTIRTVPKAGFETNATIPRVSLVQVEAVSLAGPCQCENFKTYSRSSVVAAPASS